jgi:uncharacterized SAM-binding protein YcdF (DUF218 family)
LFALSKILGFLLQPDTLLVLLVLVGLLLARSRHSRAGWRLATTGALLMFAIAVLPMDRWFLAPLEDRFPSPHGMPAQVDGIIVLGGAISPDRTERYGIPSLNEDAERMTMFVKLARLYPTAKLVFTGGSGSIRPDRPKETETAKMLFDDLGLDTTKIIFERESRNTFENAIFSKRLVDPKPGETWLLITSAAHMPRSVGIFRRAGWPVVPWPVAYKTDPEYTVGFLSHLEDLNRATYEWLGLAAYRLLGRTDTLFPAP